MTFYYGYTAIDPAGVVTTIAGNSTPGYADGTGSAASFNNPAGVTTFTPVPNLVLIADPGNNRIRYTFADTGVVGTYAGSGTPGFADGVGTSASFNSPVGVAFIPSSNVTIVADTNNHSIRVISSASAVTTLAGNGSPGFADGTGAAASFNSPYGVAVLSDGTIVVADTGNHAIRLVTSGGVVTTLAGNGSSGYADGIGTAAIFNSPGAVAVLSNGDIVVADTGNNRIRLVTLTGIVATLAGGSFNLGAPDGTGAGATFNGPIGVVVHQSGNIIVSELYLIRLVTPGGVVTTLAGSGTPGYADGTGVAASFIFPFGLAVLSSGSVVLADLQNNRIRLIV